MIGFWEVETLFKEMLRIQEKIRRTEDRNKREGCKL